MTVIKGKKKIQRKIRFNDLTFIDGKGVFTFEDIGSFKSKPLVRRIKKFWKNVRRYSQKNGDKYFQESCAMVLKGKYNVLQIIESDIDGKNYNDDFRLLAFCFKKGSFNLNNLRKFISKFNIFYLNYMKNFNDLLSLQTYEKNDPKNLLYYTSDWDQTEIKTIDYIKSWTIANEDGIHLSQKYV